MTASGKHAIVCLIWMLIVLAENSTRPFLSLIEKKWIAFQLLNAMKDVREHKVNYSESYLDKLRYLAPHCPSGVTW